MQTDGNQDTKDQAQEKLGEVNMVGNIEDTNKDESAVAEKDKSTDDVPRSVDDTSPAEVVELKGTAHEDDGGEEMDENQEDTVIY